MASRLKSFIASLQSKLGVRKKMGLVYYFGFEIGENKYNFIRKVESYWVIFFQTKMFSNFTSVNWGKMFDEF